MKPGHLPLKTVITMIEYMIKEGRIPKIARILVTMQEEYIELAILCTDGEYDPEEWTHHDLLDFLTKGEFKDG